MTSQRLCRQVVVTMKVTFSRQALMTGISLVQNSVSPAGTLPILSNVLLEAENRGSSLIATDLDTFSKVSLEGRVEEAGRTTVPARTFGDIVRLLPDDDVAIVTSGTRLTLTCNRNVYHLATMSADDYPDWPKTDTITRITLKQSDLKRLLRCTLFAVPTKDPRKVLMGANFILTPNGLVCVATDGRKLGKAIAEPVELKGKTKKEVSAIIPGRVLQEIDKAIGEEGEIELALAERQAVFSLSNLTYLTTL
ncbi:DNA polymerase III subunit beta, partial [Candidatus Sumerlaeota bacterium]|nr:DNA polymerase III subunit beta [Candidatus Sumerlaeota bacterium]